MRHAGHATYHRCATKQEPLAEYLGRQSESLRKHGIRAQFEAVADGVAKVCEAKGTPLSTLLEALRAGPTHDSFDRSRALLMAVMDFVVCVAAVAGHAEGGAAAPDEEAGGEPGSGDAPDEERPRQRRRLDAPADAVPDEAAGGEPLGAPAVRHLTMMLTREPQQACGELCELEHNGRTLRYTVPLGVDIGVRFRVQIPVASGVAAEDMAQGSSSEEEGHDEEARRHERERHDRMADYDGSADEEDGLAGEGSGVFWYNDS